MNDILTIHMNFISYREIEDFISLNWVNVIILFESIKLDQKYKKVNYNLPLTKLDIFKLSYLIENKNEN